MRLSGFKVYICTQFIQILFLESFLHLSLLLVCTWLHDHCRKSDLIYFTGKSSYLYTYATTGLPALVCMWTTFLGNEVKATECIAYILLFIITVPQHILLFFAYSSFRQDAAHTSNIFVLLLYTFSLCVFVCVKKNSSFDRASNAKRLHRNAMLIARILHFS